MAPKRSPHPASPTGPGKLASAHPSGKPQIKVDLSPAGMLYIDRDAGMPRVRATATLPPPPASKPGQPEPSPPAGNPTGQSTQYEWSVTVALPPGVPHSMGRAVVHPPIKQTTSTPVFDIPFRFVRGGTLTVNITVRNGKDILTGRATAEIRGTNPTAVDLAKQGANTNFIKLMEQEAGLRQFLTGSRFTGMPLFSQDNLGGVGLGQITRPRPTDNQIWSWKENLIAAQDLFNQKKKEARAYMDSVGKSPRFKTLASAYNAQRAAKKLKPLTITLPYTDDQLDLETIRRYNGEADGVHEFILATDSQGGLVVTPEETTLTGAAQWHQVSGDERRQQYTDDKLPKKKWGDPDYVQHVLSQP